MKNKSICIISFPSYPLFDPKIKETTGGAEIDLFLVGKHLSFKQNTSVKFLVSDFGQNNIETFNGIKVYKTSTQNNNPIQGIVSLIKLWRLLKQINADVYIQSCASFITGLIYIFCFLNNKKFIYRTTHVCDVNKDYVNKNRVAGWFYELGLKNASLILASVNSHKDMLSRLYGARIGMKTIFIPNALEMSHGEMLKQKSYTLWVARGTHWKQPELFLKLVEKYPKEKFLMIMSKQNNELEVFDKIKKQAANYKNLNLVEGVPFNAIQKYFDQAKSFINTSIDEGFTLTLIQSCIGETPMIYLNVNPDDVITKHNIGYYANGNFEKMISQLNMLLNDEKVWKAKSANAFKYAKENHNISIVGEQWGDVLKNI
jgi:glycosyltransferase involved in cell wall biosynthesis